MKVKNLWAGVITIKGIDKVVLLRDVSFGKKVIKLALNNLDDEYRCIFTNKSIWIKKQELLPLTFFLDVEEAKKTMRTKELRKLYKEKEELIKSQMVKRLKAPMGFTAKQ